MEDSDRTNRSSRRKQSKTHRVPIDVDSDVAKSEVLQKDSAMSDVIGLAGPSEHSTQSSAGNAGLSDAPTVEQDSSAMDSTAHDTDMVLPEGTIVVQPEAVEDSLFDGPEFGVPSRSSPVMVEPVPAILHCTACNHRIDTSKPDVIFQHPILNVLVCKRCCELHFKKQSCVSSSSSTLRHCTWCIAGFDLICCDFCPAMFCKVCIRRNLGREILDEILNSDVDQKWRCFVCNPLPLARLARSFIQLVTGLRCQSKPTATATTTTTTNSALSSTDSHRSSSSQSSNSSHNSAARSRKSNARSNLALPASGPSNAVPNKIAHIDVQLLPEICPELAVTEQNVWQVVEKLLAATQSMSMLLGSLSDDLRRTGALGTSVVVSDSVQKRREVATKLWRAFVAYRKSFCDIERYSRSSSGNVSNSTATVASSSAVSGAVSRLKQLQQPAPAHQRPPRQRQSQPAEVIELSDSDDETGETGSGRVSASEPPVKRPCVTQPVLEMPAASVKNRQRKGVGLNMTVSDYSHVSSKVDDLHESKERNGDRS